MTLILPRRKFLTLMAAPLVVQAANIMPVRAPLISWSAMAEPAGGFTMPAWQWYSHQYFRGNPVGQTYTDPWGRQWRVVGAAEPGTDSRWPTSASPITPAERGAA